MTSIRRAKGTLLWLPLCFVLIGAGAHGIGMHAEIPVIQLSSGASDQEPSGRYDLHLRGGWIIDGTGSPARRADILVRDDRIAWIGVEVPGDLSVERIIDASGMYITPGFIDAHTHGDPFSTPDFENFLAMGVTTISLGQDGSSPGRADIEGWMRRVDDLDLGLNIVLYVGHGTVRRLAGVELGRTATDSETEAMASLIGEAMDAGCFGLSTGLEYRPGWFAEQDELVGIALPVAVQGGLVMSHVRNEDEDAIHASIDELIAQGAGSGSAVHIAHIKVVYGAGQGRAEEVLGFMEEGRRQGVNVTADIYPYLASYTGISIVFPDWALAPNDYRTVVADRRAELAVYLRERVMKRNGPGATLFGTGEWSGRTLLEVAADLGKPFEDVLIDDIGPGGAGAAYFVMDADLQDRLLLDPRIMISTDGSPEMRHPRGYGAFARIIRKYVVEQKMLKLEEAVYKMSGLTAATIGLDRLDRGLLKEGYAADIIIFDPVSVLDHATFEQPHRFATGFTHVIVNGRIVRESGEMTDERSGRMLRHR
ncbi:amidohydrolase family protein [Gemmatimonadota bacterium]